MKKKIIIIGIIVLLLIIPYIILKTNKTFFGETYIGIQNQEIFIPKYSFFKEECCMTAAFFYSIRSETILQNQIDNYMKEFEYFEDESTYGYKKDDLFIQEYKVVDMGLYRKIIITY